MPYRLLHNATIATMRNDDSYCLIEEGAIVIQNDKICWLGKSDKVPAKYQSECEQNIDCQKRLMTPGLVDCHTHLIYAGDRASEFEQRLEGQSYAQISRQGGGIAATVRQTREASENELFKFALKRLECLMAEGVTSLEIKSGYGLDIQSEIKMLRVAHRLGQSKGLRIQKTFLGAHSVPEEFAGDKSAYIEFVCEEMLPAVAKTGLVDAVDGFCEGIAFSSAQIKQVFTRAQDLKLPIKIHAEQLSDSGGAVMAAKLGALSVDHIEYLQPRDVAVLKQYSTTAVLLPGAFYTLKETQHPPIAALREHAVPMAIASDANPGSSPITSLLLIMNMACTLFSLTPREALAGVTRNAARALGLAEQIGSLEKGKQADLVLWDTQNPAILSYQLGQNLCAGIMIGGQWTKEL